MNNEHFKQLREQKKLEDEEYLLKIFQETRAKEREKLERQEQAYNKRKEQREKEEKARVDLKDTKSFIKESGVPKLLEELAVNVIIPQKYKFLTDNETGVVKLIWGEFGQIEHNFIRFSKHKDLDISKIEAIFDKNSRSVVIRGQGDNPENGNTKLNLNDLYNPEIIEEAIEKAYLNPIKIFEINIKK